MAAFYRTLQPVVYISEGISISVGANRTISIDSDIADALGSAVEFIRFGEEYISLPYVRILQYDDSDDFPTEGEDDKFYVDLSTGVFYRWDDDEYTSMREFVVDELTMMDNLIVDDTITTGTLITDDLQVDDIVTTGVIELGDASDTTVARTGSGGDISVEGNRVYRVGGGDVGITDGGTGRSTGGSAYALVATGTTATGTQQSCAVGATTEVLVGGGASALPVWTTATGSGAPVRATSPTLATPTLTNPTVSTGTFTNPTVTTGSFTSPTLVTPVLGTPSSGNLSSCTAVTAATASTVVQRDSSANVTADNFISTRTQTASSAGTLTMTIDSARVQEITGSTTHTVKLPTTSVLAGQDYRVVNNSTGSVTVQSSGANTIATVTTLCTGLFSAQVDTPTTAANWKTVFNA